MRWVTTAFYLVCVTLITEYYAQMYFEHSGFVGWKSTVHVIQIMAHSLNNAININPYMPSIPFLRPRQTADMLSGMKIAGQLRKNGTRIYAKKSRKFEIPAVRVKLFCKAVLVCRLRALKISISVGT